MTELSSFEVLLNDDGIRPAGEKDECFYCHQKIGTPHKKDCVMLNNRVKVKLIIEVDGYCWCPDKDAAKYLIENKDHVIHNLIENCNCYKCEVQEL